MPFGGNLRWVTKLDKLGFQISTGAACASSKSGPSSVLAALGFEEEAALRGVRVSAGWETTEQDWRALLGAFTAVSVDLRE
jgi:cysteine desulfurase